jgi:hypothetical protein
MQQLTEDVLASGSSVLDTGQSCEAKADFDHSDEGFCYFLIRSTARARVVAMRRSDADRQDAATVLDEFTPNARRSGRCLHGGASAEKCYRRGEVR